MKLKKILPNLDGLEAAIAALYNKKDDGKYHLDVEDDDGAELLRAKEHEKGLRQIAERDLATAQEQLTQATARVQELTAAQATDVQTLRTQLTTEHERVVNALNAKHQKDSDQLNNAIKKTFVDNVAAGLAKEIALDEGSAELLTEVMKKRLVVEMVNGEPVTRVLQKDGSASTMSPDALRDEYFTNDKYSGIMRASDGSGGGATRTGTKVGDLAGKKLDDLTELQRNELQRTNPAELQRLVDEKRAGLGNR